MVDDRLFDAFEDCLGRLQAGAALEQVLSLYPQWERELRPMLLAAQAARQVGADLRVPQAAIVHSRAGFLKKADQMAAGRSRLASGFPLRWFALVSLVVVLVLAAGVATSVAVSAHALPGDVLYPVKIAAEQTQLLLTDDPAQRLELEQSFDQKRVVEVDTLIRQANSRDVQFAGGLKEMQGNNWLVGNIPVRVTDSTRFLSPVKPGYYVDVEGRLQPDGVVMAYQVAPRSMQISGSLSILSPEEWRVGDVSVQIVADTAVQGEPFSGSQVVIQAILLDGGQLRAVSVVIEGALNAPYQASATLRPSDTSSPQPSVAASPTDTPQPRETEIEKPQPTVEPTEVDRSEDTPKPTQGEDRHNTPEPTESENYSQTPKPTEGEDHGESPSPTKDGHYEDQKTPQPTQNEDDHRDSPTPTLSSSSGNPTPTPGGHDD
jgi:hypothetical protein